MVTNLQLLRFVAAIAVLLLHTFADLGELGFQNEFGDWLEAVGGSGVDLFFVISGFVIQRSLDRRTRDFKEFALDRLKRIAPVYWLATSLMAAMIYLLSVFGSSENSDPVSIARFLTSLTFTSQLISADHPIVRPGWSLEFEMFFYMAFSLTLLLKRKYRFAALTLLLIGLAGVSGGLFLVEFALGVAASKLVFLERFGNWNLVFAGIGMTLLGLSGSWHSLDNLWKWGIPSFMMVLGLAYSKQLKGNFWLRLGRISYPLYVFHVLVISIVKWPFAGLAMFQVTGWLAAGVFVVSSLAVAVIVDSYFDKPLQIRLARGIPSMKTRFSPRN